MLDKARALAVDEVVIDLEDAVATDAKVEARENAMTAVRRGFAARSVAVRVNAPETLWGAEDLVAVARAGEHVHSVVVPKVESPDDLALVELSLASAESVRVQALIETARGLRAVDEIARASRRLDVLILGYADLAASLGRSPAGAAKLDLWLGVQDSVLAAARAAGLQAIDGPHLSLDKEPGLRAAATRAAELGFDGKWVIHPSQLAVVTDVFTPGPDEVARAEAILAALSEAAGEQRGAVRRDGEMLDEALRLSALRTIARAQASRS
jgi:citrate lyase subunit beta/citryl-CoA lyase